MKINVACEFYAMFFSYYAKEKFIGPAKWLQDLLLVLQGQYHFELALRPAVVDILCQFPIRGTLEMKGMESSMKLVALGATQRKG